MSSRALRKLQREEEERKQLDASKRQDEEADSEEDDLLPPKPSNTFDMLSDNDDENEAQDDDSAPEDAVEETSARHAKRVNADPPPTAKAKKSKKKKGKKKVKAPVANAVQATTAGKPSPELDEIDLALKSLSTKGNVEANVSKGPTIDEANAQLYRLLAVESKHLNALNEMKRLFGNAVMDNEEDSPAAPRRRGRGPQQIDLGSALSARHSPVSRGQGLKGLALKRNPLMTGKEEWPQATSGGLGMELVERPEDGTVEYRFVHSTIYQDVQRQFDSCVASMDPQRMIALLQFNR